MSVTKAPTQEVDEIINGLNHIKSSYTILRNNGKGKNFLFLALTF